MYMQATLSFKPQTTHGKHLALPASCKNPGPLGLHSLCSWVQESARTEFKFCFPLCDVGKIKKLLKPVNLHF